MAAVFRLIALGVAGAVGCSAPAAPTPATPTVLVENPLCDSLGCKTLHIRAYVWAFPLPQGSARGAKALGQIDGPTDCLRFPPTWTATLRSVDSLGVPLGDSVVFSWTPSHPDGIYLIGLSEAVPLVGATQTFVPADAPGWNLTFSKNQDSVFTAHLRPAQPCEAP